MFFNDQITSDRTDYLRKMGVVLEGSRNTNWRLTPEQNARYFSGLKGAKWRDCRAVFNRLMTQMGLQQYASITVGKLSTGNKQKVALLCALIHQPQLLVMDEPTLGLDMQTISDLEALLISHSKQLSQGFLITSHDFSFIENICTRVLLLSGGHIAFDGSIEAFKSQLHKYECSIQTPVDVHQILLSQYGDGDTHDLLISQQPNKLTIQYDRTEQILPILQQLNAQKAAISDLSIVPISAEQAYKHISQRC